MRRRFAVAALVLLAGCGDGGGGSAPTPSPTPSVTASPTVVPPTATFLPSATPTPSATASPSASPTLTATPAPTATRGIGRIIRLAPGDDDQETLSLAFAEAQPGDFFLLGPGTYELNATLRLATDAVWVRGAGRQATILSFLGQNTPGAGLVVTGDRFVLEDLAIEDAVGDLLVLQGVEGAEVRGFRGEWPAGPTTLAVSGIAAAGMRDLLVEETEVLGATQGGVVARECERVVVRASRFEANVVGISIDNSLDAEISDNEVSGNTTGVLLRNQPNLTFVDGRRARVYDNRIVDNDAPNQAPPTSDVAWLPSGVGAMVVAYDQVEVFANQFAGNDTLQVAMLAQASAARLGAVSDGPAAFDPFSESLYVFDNTYTDGGADPDARVRQALDSIVGGLPYPDIATDGFEDPQKLVDGALPAELRQCVQEADSVRFFDLDLEAGGAGATSSRAGVDCRLERLPAVAAAAAAD